MKKVLIAGGSGLVGTFLSHQLRGYGYEVIHLSRRAQPNATFPTFEWDIKKGYIDENAFAETDVVINLAGSGIADKRWSAARKKDIIESRTQSTALLSRYLKTTNNQVKTYISASAIGYYGDRADEILDENAPAGNGFLSESTIAWERSVEEVTAIGVRTVAIRIGIVLSKKGGALPQMLLPFIFRLGVYFGNGAQWYSWIHIEDLARIFQWSIENENAKGIYNGVAPEPLTNYNLTKAIGRAKEGFFLYLPAPSFALRLLLGEMADVVLNSTRVSAQKIENEGFIFKYKDAIMALKDIFKRNV